MQYAPTLTGKKLDGLLADDFLARYILGRMLLRPTHTDQKLDSLLSIESKTRYVWDCRPSRSIYSRRGTLKICMNAPKTRRGLDRYGHFHAKPAGYSMNMAIFTQNPPRIGRIWPYSRKTRWGWDEYGHIREKLAEDRMNMATAIGSSPGLG